MISIIEIFCEEWRCTLDEFNDKKNTNINVYSARHSFVFFLTNCGFSDHTRAHLIEEYLGIKKPADIIFSGRSKYANTRKHPNFRRIYAICHKRIYGNLKTLPA